MTRSHTKRSAKAGLPPGTVVHVGPPRADQPVITVFTYHEGEFKEQSVASADGLAPFVNPQQVTWVNIDGVHDTAMLEAVGRLFGLHPLVQEDIANTHQRPKVEVYEGYLYLVVRMLTYRQESAAVGSEQVSMVLRPNLVLTFQEVVGDVFGPIRDRIRAGKCRLRKMGADYLAYSLLDAIVDNYFVVLEQVGEVLEDLEDEVALSASAELIQQIHVQKRNMIALRRAVWPLREAVVALERDEAGLISPPVKLFLRDLYDHTIGVLDMVEAYRDIGAELLDIYLSSISNRLNQVMKTLTIIATIFMPLTFIVGVYGTNFNYLPELKWHYGYFAMLGLCAAISIVMLIWFRRRKWL